MATLTLIYGDGFLVRERFRERIRELECEEITTITAGAKPESALEAGRALPFMEPQNVVHIKNVMPKQGGQGRTTRDTDWPAAVEELGGMPPSTTYLWTEGALARNSRLVRQAGEHGETEHLETPRGAGITKWIRERAHREGMRIATDGIAALTERCGEDLWRMSQEIGKLALWAGDSEVRRRDVEEVVEERGEATIFRAIDDLYEGRARRAGQGFEAIMEAGGSPYYILTMLQREARNLALLDSPEGQRASAEELMTALGTNSEFAVRKAREHRDSLDERGVDGWYDSLCAADRLIKNGSIRPEQAVIGLAATLAQTKDG